MCVCVWHVWTMGRLSLSPSCPNPLWRGWITHLILAFFSPTHSFSHSPFFSPLPKGLDKGRPVLLSFCVCVCARVHMCVCRGPVLLLQEMAHQWALCRCFERLPPRVCLYLGLHESVCVSLLTTEAFLTNKLQMIIIERSTGCCCCCFNGSRNMKWLPNEFS